MGAKVSASVSTEDIRRSYYESAGYSMWITEFEIDPLQLIVCDDSSGKYFRVGVNLSGDEFTFDPPVEVAIQYQDVPASQSTTARARASLTWASREESRKGMPIPRVSPADAAKRIHKAPVAGQANGPSNQEGSVMDSAKIREALGLAADAPDDDVRAVLAAAGLAPNPTTEPTPPTTTTNPGTPNDPELPPTLPNPSQASASGAILLDPAQYAALRTAAARGEQAWRQMREQEGDRVLDEAIRAGKFAPARRDHYKALWAADPDGTRQLIDGLAANVIPLSVAGFPGVGDESEQDLIYAAMYPGESTRGGGGRG
jgi:Mu-like prophage I protein